MKKLTNRHLIRRAVENQPCPSCGHRALCTYVTTPRKAHCMRCGVTTLVPVAVVGWRRGKPMVELLLAGATSRVLVSPPA